MNVKKDKGSIAIFVLVALLFMSAFLIISFASNVNKSKTVKEQFNIISGIYAYANGEEGAYDKAYSDLRNKNKQTMTASSENSSTLELTKTFDENMSNYRIYGNSIQNGTPTPDNPVEVQSVGDMANLFNFNDINFKNQNSSFKLNIEKQDNSIIIDNSTNQGGSYAYTNNIECLNLKPNTTYTSKAKVILSCTQTGGTSAGSMAGCLYLQTNNTFDTGTKYLIVGETGFIESHKGEEYIVYSTFTTPTDMTEYKYLATRVTGYGIITFSDIVLVEGSYNKDTFPISDYVPYGKYKIPVKLTNESGESETTNIYLDEPLRKVGNYADYIDFKSGKVVRNIGVIENYNISSIYCINNNTVRFAVFNPEILTRLNTKEILCEILPYKGAWLLDEEYAFQHDISQNHFYLSFTKTRLGITDDDTNDTMKQKAKDYLSTLSNKKIYYPMQEIKEESITLPQLKSCEDYTKIEVLTSVAPSKIEVEYMGYTLE